MSAAGFAYLNVVYSYGPPQVSLELFFEGARVHAWSQNQQAGPSNLQLRVFGVPVDAPPNMRYSQTLKIDPARLRTMSGFAKYVLSNQTVRIPLVTRFDGDIVPKPNCSYDFIVTCEDPSHSSSPFRVFTGTFYEVADAAPVTNGIEVPQIPIEDRILADTCVVEVAPLPWTPSAATNAPFEDDELDLALALALSLQQS